MENPAVVPAQDTARRVSGLLTAGVTAREIAEASRLSLHDIGELASRASPVPVHVARAVELAWDYLFPVPARHTARRVAELLDAGVTVRQVADASGLDAHRVRAMRSGTQPVTPYVERQVKEAWGRLLLPPAETARRVAELLDLDFTASQIAAAAGLPVEAVTSLPGWKRRVPFFLAEAIEQADVVLMGQAIPPDEPDPVIVERIIDGWFTGKLPRPERREAVRQLYEAGLTPWAISERLHVGDPVVKRDLAALGIERRAA